MKKITMLLPLMGAACFAQPLWKNKAYAVYSDRVTQGQYTAKAVSATELRSDYQSPVNTDVPATIEFKFSINGKDNEMPVGSNHRFTCTGTRCETPLISFGKPLKTIEQTGALLAPSTAWTIRLDMRPVLAALNKDGYYTTYNGNRIYKDDFKAVYIAGSTSPLIWDFDNLYNHRELEMKDPDGDGIYEATLTLNVPAEQKQTASVWKLGKDISAFPQYTSDQVLANAIYNMSLEEMINAVEPDSTFRTGKEWAGVWTRDISYSIILSMAYLQPEVARKSLLRKVTKKKRIIQDTGTGGAWPVSTDRMIWAVAAWEIYLATGDRNWLEEAYTIIRNSLQDDYRNVYDARTGLVRGESSFLDWREQTYPRWMQPADIFESENLGTNAVHYQANRVLSQMARLLGKPSAAVTEPEQVAARIKQGINRYLWQPGRQYYGQYLYGGAYPVLSPRAEALGEALTILFDIADSSRQQQLAARVPVTDYGIPCIYPQLPGIPPYHNNAVWPFVQTYWLWAGAKAGNEQSVMSSISAIYRPAALFATNKENFVAANGDFAGTQINSSNMLWSLAGNLSIVHKVLFGIRFGTAGLTFAPFVPRAYAGTRTLQNFTYRQAVLDITLEGFGNTITAFSLDDRVQAAAGIPTTLTGRHRIRIVLGNRLPDSNIPAARNDTTPETPAAVYASGQLRWEPIAGAVQYEVLKNGSRFRQLTGTALPLTPSLPAMYTVVATDRRGGSSFTSAPVLVAAEKYIRTYPAEQFAPPADRPYQGFTGSGFIETSTSQNTRIDIPVTAAIAGTYRIDCRYANGNGPTNTENKCAVRTLLVDGKPVSALVFPQRGTNEWSNWGFSSGLSVVLTKGTHTLSLAYLPENENMNGAINQAMIDFIRVIYLGSR